MIKFFKQFQKMIKKRGSISSLKNLDKENIKKRRLFFASILLVLLPVAFLLYNNTKKAEAAWWNDRWLYRKRLVIDNTKVSGSANLTDFTVLYSNTADTDLANNAQADGGDIVFVDLQGVIYDHEIENFDSGTGNLQAWIQIPTLKYNEDTILYMYYGNPSVNDQEDPAATWDDDYQVIFHLNESTTGDTDFIESSRNHVNSDSVTIDGSGDAAAAGKIAGGVYLDGANDVISSSDGSKINNTGDLTLSAWIYRPDGSTDDDIIELNGDGSGEASNDNYTFFVNDGDHELRLWWHYGASQSVAGATSSVGLTNGTGTWTYVVATRDVSGNTVTFFENGSQLGTDISFSNDPTGGTATPDLIIGVGDEPASSQYEGVLDEIRVSKIIRSDDWISTEYTNMNAPEAFFSSIGSQEQGTGPVLWLRLDEGYGSTANDSSSGNNNGTITSSTWSTEENCVSGMCLEFDGSNSNINITDNANIDFDSSSFTIQAWIRRPEGVDVQDFIMQKFVADASDGGYGLEIQADNTIRFGIDDDGTSYPEDSAASSATFDDNEWHLVTGVKTGTSKIELFVDGVEVGQDTSLSATGSVSNNDALRVGSQSNGTSNVFDGWIDEVKIYPYARTPNQIKSDYQFGTSSLTGSSASAGPSRPNNINNGLVGYWPMDETTSNTCTGGTNDSCDKSGLGNDAAWSGNAASARGKFGSGVELTDTGDEVQLATTTGIDSVGGAAWYNASWTRRQAVTVTNNTGAELTNFEVEFDITYDASMQVDFDDLIFTSSNGTTVLDFWLETKSDGTDATVWVEIPTLAASSDTTVYMYYGNPSASSASDGTTTFDFFDGFDGTGIDTSIWTIDNASGWSVSGGNLNGGNTWGRITSIDTFSDGVVLDIKHNASAINTNGYMIGGFWLSTSDGAGYLMHPGNDWYFDEGSFTSFGTDAGSGIDMLLTVTTKSTTKVDIVTTNYSSGATLNSVTDVTNTVSNEEIALGYRYDNNFPSQNYTATWDWILVRDYIISEPTVAFGTEETYPPSANITMAAWVKADTLDSYQRNIISRGTSSSYDWYLGNSSTNAGKLEFTTDGGSNTGFSTTTLSTGNWYHVALVAESTTNKLYINGELDKEITSSGGLPSDGNVTIGAASDALHSWDGVIDEVRIYNRALNASDVATLYKWAPKPVAHWPFNENTGTSTAYDVSGNGLNGTMTNMAESAWVPGKYGSALHFDATNDFVSVGNNSLLNPSHNMTVEAWVKFDRLANTLGDQQAIVRKDDSGLGDQYGLFQQYASSEERFYFYWRNSDGTNFNVRTEASTIVLETDKWYHVAATRNGADMKIYVDGIDRTGGSSLPSATDTLYSGTPSNLRIGADSASNDRLDGIVDDVRIYNYARTLEQVTQDRNAGHPSPGSPIGSAYLEYNFETGYGNTVFDKGTGKNNATVGAGNPEDYWTLDGKFGRAHDFNGSSEYLYCTDASCGGTSKLDFDGSTDFTYSAWIKSTNTGNNQVVMSKKNVVVVGAAGYMIYANTSDNAVCNISDASNQATPTSSTDVIDGNWHHITCVNDGSNLKIYVDGVEEDSASMASVTGTFDTTVNFRIGNQGNSSNYFGGSIDDVRIYKDAFTAAQVAMLYNQGKSTVLGVKSAESDGTPSNSAYYSYCPPGYSGTCKPPALHLNFDQYDGTGAYAVKDISSTEAHATMASGLTNTNWQPGKYGGGMKFDNNGGSKFVNLDGSMEAKLDNTVLDSTSGSLFVWANLDVINDGSDQQIVLVGCDQTQNYAKIQKDNAADNLQYLYESTNNQESYTHSDTTIWDKGWLHLGMTWSEPADEVNYYLNGRKVNTDVSLNGTGWGCITTSNIQDVLIGEGSEDNWNGWIDEVMLFGYELTEGLVSWIFNKGKPVAHYKLDECESTTAYDTSGNAYNGTISIGSLSTYTSAGSCSSGTGTEAWNAGTNGRFNASLAFDGSDDQIYCTDANCGGTTNLDFGADTEFSYTAWVKGSTSKNQVAVSKKNVVAVGAAGWTMYIPSSDIADCTISDGTNEASAEGTTDVIDGSWHFIACVNGASNIYTFVDGLQEASASNTSVTGTLDNTSDFVIGDQANDANPFNGQIDDVRVYNYALTDEQILMIMNEGSSTRFGD